MDTFTILYFASANTFTKRKDEKLPAPLVLSKLFETLEEKYPGIETKVLSSSALTINLEYVDLDDNADLIIAPGDEVAIIPPGWLLPGSILQLLSRSRKRLFKMPRPLSYLLLLLLLVALAHARLEAAPTPSTCALLRPFNETPQTCPAPVATPGAMQTDPTCAVLRPFNETLQTCPASVVTSGAMQTNPTCALPKPFEEGFPTSSVSNGIMAPYWDLFAPPAREAMLRPGDEL